MSRWKSLSFLLVFAVPALLPLAAAWHASLLPGSSALAPWMPLFVLFVLLPAADYAIGHDRGNVPTDQEAAVATQAWFRVLTLAALPVQLGVLAWSGHWFVNTPLGPGGTIGWLLSQGVVGGVLAINTAHELIHKNGRLEPLTGGALLASVGYHGFKVEHLRGHHVHVSTPADASSARFGQSLWHFLPRALWMNTRNAWRLEAARLRAQGLGWLHWRNELLWWTALWLSFATLFLLWLGAAGMAFFFAQGLIAATTLEIINYIEHYGLERTQGADGRFERVRPEHSWNSDYALSNALLFQLQRHSDHHAFPKRRYPILRHHDSAPQLPGGYAAMFLLAMAPPLWRRLIDPKVKALAGNASAD